MHADGLRMQAGPQEAGAVGAPLEMFEGNAKDPNPLTHGISAYLPLRHDSEVAVDPGMNTKELVRTLLVSVRIRSCTCRHIHTGSLRESF
jgi:hypothetical protein